MPTTHHLATARWDAVVVGARVAGAATALLLARAGRRVLVVDRAPRGSDTLSTHALMRPAVASLQRLGVLDEIIDAGAPLIRGVDFRYGDDVERVDLRPGGGIDGLVAPRRTLLDRVLVDAAEAAGATVRTGVDVTDVTRHPAGRVTGVVGRVRGGRSFTATAEIVVGADGARSRVADRVGAPVVHRGTAAGGVVYGYVPTSVLVRAGIAGDRYRWCYRPGHGAGVIPTDGGLSCVWAGGARPLVAAARRAGVAAAFDALLTPVAPEVAAALTAAAGSPAAAVVGPLRGHHGTPALTRRPHGPGWALVGDAGMYRDPVTSHGISDALRDAQMLAVALTDPGSRPQALARYAARRDAMAGPVLAATEAVAAFDWDLPALRTHLLDLSAAMKAETRALTELAASSRAA